MNINRYKWGEDSLQKMYGLFFSFFFLVIFSNPVDAQDSSKTQADLFQILSEERDYSETSLLFLNNFGTDHFEKYVEGIEKYGKARSKFNGLIEFMKNRLIEGKALEASESFGEKLKTAVEKRIAFTTFVEEEIIGDQEGTRGPPKLSLGDPLEWAKILIDVAKTVWQEYRSSEDQRRKELIDQLDALKWKRHHQIGGAS